MDILGQIDQVEPGIDRKLERRQAAAADEAQAGGHPALDPDLFPDPADRHFGLDGLEENGVFLDQIQAREFEAPVQGQTVFWESIYIYYHRLRP